jgi:alkaline phosphatase D
MLQIFTLALALTTTSTASFVSNLNYGSPSHHHPALGISIRKVAARNIPSAAWNSSQLNFTHGVASGDPYSTSVILWTRASPSEDNDRSNITVSGNVPLYNHDTGEYVKASKAPVCLQYKVAKDQALEDCVDEGTVYTSSDIDFTVKVEAKGLKPFTQYCK